MGLNRKVEAATRCPRFPFDDTFAACGILGADPLTMNTSQILQHLYSLDSSSPYFVRYLDHLIQSDEEDYLLSLQGPELARLVDFLDGVCVLPSVSFRPAYKRDPAGPRGHPYD